MNLDQASAADPLMPAVPLSLKVPLLISLGVGVVAVILSAVVGHWMFGALLCVGLALGLLNIRLVQRGVAKVTAEDHPSKRVMAYNSFARLAVITAFALVIGFVMPKPDGLGVFFGLALFQAIFVMRTTVPVMKGLRQQS